MQSHSVTNLDFHPAVFHNLGIDWASTLIALIAVVMIPIPFLYVYGPP